MHTASFRFIASVRLTAFLVGCVAVLAAGPLAYAEMPKGDSGDPDAPLEPACALLDDNDIRQQMDGLLLKLLIMCDRADELGQVRQAPAIEPVTTEAGGTDVPVSDPSGDVGSNSHTQSETSMAVNEANGTICSGYNDSFHGLTGNGYTGFSRSVDGGASFEDRGALSSNSYGDPALVWRKADGHFYFAALHTDGLGIWGSTDDCATFSFIGMIHSSGGDDKELMAVDNNPSSPYFGRLYVQWTDFSAGGLWSTASDDAGATWTTPVRISDPGADVQGVWPTVAPNGDVYAAWVRDRSSGPIDIEVTRSTDGGVTFTRVSNPITDEVIPRDAAATSSCGRVALRGNIRYLPSPQIVVGPDGVVHVVYSYDPDGLNSGDVVDVFYRRSTDSGATWDPEVRLNDDATTNDQFYPTVSVGTGNIVSAAWYDRREDPDNMEFKYYHRFSYDGGVTWEPSEAVSDEASPVYLDPDLATCYHGDYDTHIQTETHAVPQWSDDRNIQGGHNDPDVFADLVAVSTDFLLTPHPNTVAVCAPDNGAFTIDVLQFSGFSEPVTLATGALPPGLSSGFSVNPVTPPGTSDLTLSGTGGVTPGSYDIDVTGTSDPGAIVHDAAITLGIFNALPGEPALTEPVDGALNVPLQPVFTWTAATQAAFYTLQVDDDPAFGSPAVVESGISETDFTLAVDLMSNTVYFWRVTAENTCGTGSTSPVYTFTTVALPGDCGLGTVPVVQFVEDFETGAAGWTHGGNGDTWTISGARVHGGAFSYHATDVDTTSDQWLESPDMMLPSVAPVTLQFWNWQQMEEGWSNDCWDGGILEISTDGGSNWTYLPTGVMETDPYDGPVAGFDDEFDGWCGDPQDWLRSVVDLNAYAGETARFRFRLGTDSSVGREGWYVDDLRIQSCEVTGEDFTLSALPATVTACQGSDANFTVGVGSAAGFTNDVTLEAAGNPAGSTVSFSTNPVTPPGSSVLTVGNTGAATIGNYPMTISGAATGSSGHDTAVTLEIAGAPLPPTLALPADGAVDQPLRPVFQWVEIVGADGYTLEVDDDPAFGSPEITETGILDTSFTPATDLEEETTYWWRVAAENFCGAGSASGEYSFNTLTLMPFLDGFESGDTSVWSQTQP